MTEYIQYTPKGYKVTSYGQAATAEDLLAMERFIDSTPETDYDEDPDSDGYGWERAALRGIG